MASLSQSVHCGWNKLAKLGRCVSQVHFVKIQFGKIQFGKIQFGKILFGKYSLVKFSSENTVWNEGMSCRLINPIKCLKKHKSLGFLLEGIL